jgi:membrane associated rhomboid family serine protease
VTAPPEDPAADLDLRCYRHPDRSTGIRCVRCDRPICPACMIPASVGFQCPECVAEGRRTVRAPRTIYGGRVRPGARPDAVTLTLIGINVVVFLITTLSGANALTGSGGTSTIYNHFALVPVQVAHGQWWRLFTSAFLHYGILHIGFNMYALYIFGPPLEAALGRLRYVVLYLMAGVGGGLLSVGLGPIGEQAAGASGAIFGLFGAFYVIARHRNIQTGPVVITIVINLILSFSIPDIDWRGHVGGLVVGLLVALVYARAPAARRNLVQATGVVVLAVVMAAGGYLAAHQVYKKCPILQTTSTGAPEACFAAPTGQE